MMMDDIGTWLMVSEAARLSGLSQNRVRMLAQEGKLRALSTHLGWLIHPDEPIRLRQERMQPGYVLCGRARPFEAPGQ